MDVAAPPSRGGERTPTPKCGLHIVTFKGAVWKWRESPDSGDTAREEDLSQVIQSAAVGTARAFGVM